MPQDGCAMALLGVETIVTLDKYIEASKLNCPLEYPDQLEKTRSQFVVELGRYIQIRFLTAWKWIPCCRLQLCFGVVFRDLCFHNSDGILDIHLAAHDGLLHLATRQLDLFHIDPEENIRLVDAFWLEFI
jgi:hypothetical protein